MKHTPLKVLLLALVLAPALPALADKSRTVALVPEDVSKIELLDEVTIAGDRTSLMQAQKAVIEAEDRFYARFNELNTDRRFDVVCRNEAPLGTRIKFRVCQPAYVDDATSGEAQAALTTTVAYFRSPAQIRAERLVEFRQKTLDLIRKDPELMRALIERARLEQHYKELRKEKFKNRWFVWD